MDDIKIFAKTEEKKTTINLYTNYLKSTARILEY